MKTLFSFLMFLACTALVSAAEYYYGTFSFYSGKDSAGNDMIPVCYQYASEDAATQGQANEPLVKNEILRVCIVRDKRGNAVNEFTSPAVAIDVAGQLVCADCGTIDFAKHDETCDGNAVGAKWLDLYWKPLNSSTLVNGTFITVGDVEGMPGSNPTQMGTMKKFGFDVKTATDVSGVGGAVYMYLVALDTRMGDGTCVANPTRVRSVKSYAMSLCFGTNDETYVEASPDTPRAWCVNASDGGIFTPSPGREMAWQPSAEITSLVVDGETLTGDALVEYLTPSVSKMALTENGLSLTATAPDVMYYTLYTKAALSDTDWERFEDFVTRNKNSLDNIDGKRYTRFCIDGKSLSIPLVGKEASRFYMLSGE